MYAIIEDGGKQYKVEKGLVFAIELPEQVEGQQTLEFDRVLFYQDEKTTLIGQPILEQVKVTANIKDQAQGPKLYPAQFRRRKNSRRRIGHRQKYVHVEITDIVCS